MGAIISAILSTVDSVLLSGASILSNNLLVRSLRLEDDRAQMLCTRLCVLALGATAYLCALSGNGVKELVEVASSFGSAGLVPLLCFGLFSRFGGPRAATSALLVGLVGWGLGALLDLSAPYIISVLAAMISYIVTAYLSGERRDVPRSESMVDASELT
jgi:Na+/proline symporter